MIEVLTFLSILFGGNKYEIKEVIDYCSLDRSHLKLDQQIEFGIGCSTVNGKNAYSDQRLKWWYNDGKSYVTKEKMKKWQQNK